MTGAGGKRIPLVLVADDDEDILALVTFDLEQEGFEVIAARDGEEALRLALDRSPEVAVLDVVMPKLDGYEVTRRIREHDGPVRTPVILLTARVQVRDVLHGFQAGADDYVTKPFNPEELRTRIRALLQLRLLRRGNATGGDSRALRSPPTDGGRGAPTAG